MLFPSYSFRFTPGFREVSNEVNQAELGLMTIASCSTDGNWIGQGLYACMTKVIIRIKKLIQNAQYQHVYMTEIIVPIYK